MDSRGRGEQADREEDHEMGLAGEGIAGEGQNTNGDASSEAHEDTFDPRIGWARSAADPAGDQEQRAGKNELRTEITCHDARSHSGYEETQDQEAGQQIGKNRFDHGGCLSGYVSTFRFANLFQRVRKCVGELGQRRTGVRVLFVFLIAVIPAVAQMAAVEMRNLSRPGRSKFQIGDRFEVVIHGLSDQPVSVRTTMHGRTNWGPVIGQTDAEGRWSTSGQFEKSDFGDWSEAWTVGGKLAKPVVEFGVDAPCLKEGHHLASVSGRNYALMCDTPEGQQTFASPSDSAPFRTPDGRMVPGRGHSNQTAEQYWMETMEYRILTGELTGRQREFGDEAAALIAKVIGVNALTEKETRNVLAIIHAAFEEPENIPEAAREPIATFQLLQNLAGATNDEGLKEEIAETVAFVR